MKSLNKTPVYDVARPHFGTREETHYEILLETFYDWIGHKRPGDASGSRL